VAKSITARTMLTRVASWTPTVFSTTRTTITTIPPTMSHGLRFSGSQKIDR